MLKALLLSFAFFYLPVHVVMAQKKKIITYTHEARIDFKSRVDTTIVEEKEGNINYYGDLKAYLDTITKPRLAYITCWRQDADVVMVREEKDGTKQQTYFDVDKLLFKVVDSSKLAQTGKVDTTAMSWNFKDNPEWQVTYNIIKTGQHKNILGYPCTLYTIEEIKITEHNGKPDKLNISLWATNAIKPAISTHAVLAFYDKVLVQLTPLEVEIRREMENGGTYQKLTAIKVQQQP